jgi:hypothetical protein
MTTNFDDQKRRLNSSGWGTSKEYTVGVPIDGFVDPTGEYPKRGYYFSSSISNAALGTKINNLSYGGGWFNVSFDIAPQKSSLFPFNQAQETASGHTFEVDDTPGGERILIKHLTGAGVELKPDGSVLIISRKNTIQVTGGDEKVIVEGSGDITYNGNLNLNVTGDYNVNVGGNYNINVGANTHQEFDGSLVTEVADRMATIVRGSRDDRTHGFAFDMALSGRKKVIKGEDVTLIEGEMNTHVSDDIRFTSKTNFFASSKNIGIVGSSLHVTGETGIVGGEQTNHYGKLFAGPADGKGTETTFYGSLVGKATEAFTSEYAQKAKDAVNAVNAKNADTANRTKSQTYSEGSVGTYSPDYQFTFAFDPDLNFVYHNEPSGPDMPTARTTSLYLQTSENGIKDVVIDKDDIIADRISKTGDYGGYFNKDPNIYEVRSKLRSFDFSSLTEDQTKCINTLRAESRLSLKFREPQTAVADVYVNRVSSTLPESRFGYNILGNPLENRSKKFRPTNFKIKSMSAQGMTRTIVPDPVYNPDVHRGKITMDTELASGVTLGRFFGAVGSSTSLDFFPDTLERQNIARQLYMHAQLLAYVQDHPDFTDFRVVVSEGIYSKLLDEPEPHANSLNVLKKSGRAVVYQVLNSFGKVDFAKTFDLARYWKDFVLYEKLILDYDLFDPNGRLASQIAVIMPEITTTYNATFNLDAETVFNGHVQSDRDLIEFLQDETIGSTVIEQFGA